MVGAVLSGLLWLVEYPLHPANPLIHSVQLHAWPVFTQRKIPPPTLLIFGLSANLLLLGYYKYADFFITNWNGLTGWNAAPLHLLLPLGISFFTFTQIAYLVDAYRHQAREYGLVNYILFVTFFPHLIAGPILHHKEMMPQFDRLRGKLWNWNNVLKGTLLFSIGLGKK